MTKTAVVILNYNGQELLRRFLPSVILHTPRAEIVVADNGSSDQSVAIIRKEFPTLRLIELGKNYGFCGGYNRALQEVHADYFVLLNSDVEVSENWLGPLTTLLNNSPSVAAVQPKILAYHDRRQFEYAGAGGGFIDTLGYPFCRGRIFESVEEDHGQYNDTRQVFWASGACMMVRANVFKQFGGLDEDLFAHMEEIDLCWKINRAGLEVFYCGESTVYHVGAGTLGYESAVKTFLNFRNGLVLIFKHFDTFELLYKFPFRLILDWMAAIFFLLKGRAKAAASVVRAHVDFARGLRMHAVKRRKIRRQYPEYPRANVHPGLIVFSYYLGRNKVAQ